MRTFFVKHRDLMSTATMCRPSRDSGKFAEVVLRRDLPRAALDVAGAITHVNQCLVVLSEQLDELAGLVRKNFRRTKRAAKSAKKSDRF